MVIVCIGSEGQVRDHRTQMQHGGKLYPQFARRVDGYSDLKGFADSGGFHALADTAPESGVQKNYIYGGIQNVCGKLLEVDHNSIRCKWDPDHLARSAHPIQTVHRIL